MVAMATASAWCQPQDTIHVYFELDNTSFSDQTGKYIDSLIATNIIPHEGKITVLGYADYLGSSDYNNVLSKARARRVQDYLIGSGFEKDDIILCMGKGKIDNKGKNGRGGNAPDRKVDIIVRKLIDTPAIEKFEYAIQALKINEALPLTDVHFFRGSLRITPQSLPELHVLYDYLKQNSTYIVQLEGHVCCLGPEEGKDEPYDQSTLSTKRAEGIYDSLVSYGIPASRMKYVGLGNNNPIAVRDWTEEEMEMNRRVEVRILSK